MSAVHPRKPLRILLADDPEQCRFYQEFLAQLGHEVAGQVHTGKDLIDRFRDGTPFDLVITESKLPDMDGIAAAIAGQSVHLVPVILVTACHDHDLIERALSDHVLAYLSKPFKAVDLAVAILLVAKEFAVAQGLRQALEDRKRIEVAKGLLMKRLGMDEATAMKSMRTLAMNRNLTLIEMARQVISGEDIFGLLGQS